QITVPVCNDSPAEGSVLGQILFLEWKRVQILICAAMMRGLLTEEVAAPTVEVVTPTQTKCKHGLRADWCAHCKVVADYLVSKRPMDAKRYTTPRRLFKKDRGYHAMPIDVHVQPVAPKFSQVTPDDVDWATRQSAFEHSLTMPRKAANFCAELGMYVQQNWEP